MMKTRSTSRVGTFRVSLRFHHDRRVLSGVDTGISNSSKNRWIPCSFCILHNLQNVQYIIHGMNTETLTLRIARTRSHTHPRSERRRGGGCFTIVIGSQENLALEQGFLKSEQNVVVRLGGCYTYEKFRLM